MKRVLLISNILAFYAINANAQWVQQNSGTINDLNTVFFSSPNTGYMVDANGNLFKTVDGGTNWNNIIGVNVSPALYFTSNDTGYSSSTAGILKTEDGGLTWIDNFPYTPPWVQKIYFVTNTIGFAVALNSTGDSIQTYKTINAGGSWSLQGTIQSPLQVSGLVFTSATTGFMIMNSIFKTTDGGVTWIPILATTEAATLIDIAFPSSSVGYAVGIDSTFKTTDGGNTWNSITNINSSGNLSVFFSDNNHGYAVGGDGISTGAIIKTVDGGNTWTLSLGSTYTFYSVSFPNTNTGYVCGSNGSIYKLDLTSNINEITKDDEITVYPNPFSAQTTISFNNEELRSIKIIDVLGKEIKTIEPTRERQVVIEKGEMQSGIYFVQAQSEKGILNKKIIVQ